MSFFVNETCEIYLKLVCCIPGNNMSQVRLHRLEMIWTRNKKYKNGYHPCQVRLHNNLVRVFFGFRIGLGVGDTVGGPVLVVWSRLFNHHLNVPREQTGLIETQTLFQLQIGACAHETLDKVLTESVSPLWVYPILDRWVMIDAEGLRTGQEYHIEVYPHQFRSGVEEGFDPDMHVTWQTLCVKNPRLTIVHIT